MKAVLTIIGAATLALAACTITGETQRQTSVPSYEAQESITLATFHDVFERHSNKPLDACGVLEWLEEAGARGVPGAQAIVAVHYAFDISSCYKIEWGDPQNDVRAYAWLTDEAIAALRRMGRREKTAFLRGITVPPKVTAPAVQKVLDERYAAERGGITNLNDLRKWVRSRMTVRQVEEALRLRAALVQ